MQGSMNIAHEPLHPLVHPRQTSQIDYRKYLYFITKFFPIESRCVFRHFYNIVFKAVIETGQN